MNMGTQINQLLTTQGFDYGDYGRVKLRSTPTGLHMLIHAHTDNATHIDVNLQENGTYTIKKGLMEVTELASNIAEENLSAMLKKVLTI